MTVPLATCATPPWGGLAEVTPRSLFVSGTGTGVGKTFVTAALAAAWRSQGVDVGVMKPIATGCVRGANGWVSEDALFLRRQSGVLDELDLINPVRFVAPLAPLVAARLEGREHEDLMAACRAAYCELTRRHEVMLVEGVGGLLVPLHLGEQRLDTCATLAAELNLPVLVVAARTLGTINHTLLTCRLPMPDSSPIVGLVFNDSERVADNDLAAQTSPAIIAELTGLPIWHQMPFQPASAGAAHVNL